MNIHWAQVTILLTLSVIVGIGTVIGVQHESLFGKFVYAQPSTDNTTGLPPVELESVEPEASQQTNTTTSKYLQYDDSDIGFKIDYPSDWDVQDAELTNNAVVVFSPPDQDIEVDVKLLPRTNSESLKSFGDKYKETEGFYLSSYYRNSTTLLAGQPAIRVEGTAISSPNVYEQMTGEEPTTRKILAMVTPLKGQKSFLQVIYFADKSNYLDYLPMVEHMFKSFQLNSAKPVIQED